MLRGRDGLAAIPVKHLDALKAPQGIASPWVAAVALKTPNQPPAYYSIVGRLAAPGDESDRPKLTFKRHADENDLRRAAVIRLNMRGSDGGLKYKQVTFTPDSLRQLVDHVLDEGGLLNADADPVRETEAFVDLEGQVRDDALEFAL